MSLEEEIGNEEELKREFKRLDDSLRQDPAPIETLTKIQSWVEETSWNPEHPSKLTEFFLRQMIPKFVTNLLKRSDFAGPEDENVEEIVNGFLYCVQEMIIKLMPYDFVELSETLCKILTMAQTPFYTKYGNREIVTREEPTEEPTENRKKTEVFVTSFYTNNVALFGRRAGFDEIYKRIERKEPKIPLSSLRWLVRTVTKARDGLDITFLKKYVEPLQVLCFKHILDLTDEELKNEDKKILAEIILQFDILLRQVLPISKVNMKIENFRLALALKCFKSPYLEKRMSGLIDIKELINAILRKEEAMTRMKTGIHGATNILTSMWLTPQVMIKWLRENKLMEYLFGQNLHPELLRRCVDIPKFFSIQNEMTNEYLDLIWDASLGKHESIQHIIYNIVGELSMQFSTADIDYMFEKIKKIPFESYDHTTLLLVRTITNHGISKSKTKKMYGLQTMWDLIQDSTPIPIDINMQSLSFLCEFLVWPPCHTFRQHFLEATTQNLAKSYSVPQSLKVLGKIIESFPQPTKGRKKETIIEWIDSNYQLLDNFFKDFANYNQKARIIAATIVDPSLINYTNLIGKYSHLQQVRDRLDFLDQLLATSSLSLSEKQVDCFWECVIAGALTNEERDLGFNWLENARGKLVVPKEDPFTDEVTQYLFLNKVPTLDLSQLSVRGFDFFEFYFRYINWKNGLFKQKGKEYIVCSLDLLGLDILWKITLEARDPTVGRNAIVFLNCLHKNLSAELRPMVGKQREDYVRICMLKLREASEELLARGDIESNDETTERLKLRIDRCLTLIRTFMDEFETKAGLSSKRHGVQSKGLPITISVQVLQGPKFELQMFMNETVSILKQKVGDHIGLKASMVRVITQGKELKHDAETLTDLKFSSNQSIHIARRMPKIDSENSVSLKPSSSTARPVAMIEDSEDETILPSHILSNQIYFNQLFHMLNLGEEIGQKIWDLLMLLPTNKGMLDDLMSLQEQTGEEPNWSRLIDFQSTFKLLYSLQIVDSLTQNDEQINDKAQWCNKFVQKGGVKHLVNVLLTGNVLDRSKGSKRGVCCALLLKIVNFFALHPAPIPTLRENVLQNCVDLPSLVSAMMNLLFTVASQAQEFQQNRQLPPLTGPTLPQEPEEGEIARYSTGLLIATCLADVKNLASWLENPGLKDWVLTVLFAPEASIRAHVTYGIHSLCRAITDQSLGNFLPHTFFLRLLLDLLPTLDIRSTTCEQYFELLNKLVSDSCAGFSGGSPQQFVDLFESLMKMIKTHPIIEKRHSADEDSMLMGLLILACTLVSADKSFRVRADSEFQLVNEIFWKCLFEIPTMNDHGANAPPKCKTRNSRAVAYRLLVELVRDCESSFKELTSMLLEQHYGGDKRIQWHYLPGGAEKSACGFVGLKNLGATCYMNSLMQQFYMIPTLRYELFSVNKQEEDKGNSLLYQLQTLFANLQESEKKYYDTRPFCGAYKENGQPMNTSVQMDADEFFNIFFDRLENVLKGTPQEAILKRLFGGTLTNQIISKECGHLSEREESFYTLSLEIKNKKNIQESLDLYVQGDMLEGDNKYFCGQCSAKVDAVKRCCIKDLPNTLIIHLKRFEFDLETMRRIKLNDFCEFPVRLNMEAYTKEGLAKRDNPNAETEVRPPPFYEYELAGVLVHTGTAESGHYYSFIRERGAEPATWYSFNDIQVDPFDPRELSRACYGGVDSMSQWDPQQGKYVQRYHSRANNAYMLFYERVQPTFTDEGEKMAIEPSRLVPQDIFQAVWEENMNFLRDKNIFDVDYFAFLWSVVYLDSSPPVLDYLHPSTLDFHPTMRSIELGTRFIAETLSHAKEKQNLRLYVEHLQTLYAKHTPACIWFLETLADPMYSWLKQMLLVCIISETREAFANLVINVMMCLGRFERDLYAEEENAYLQHKDDGAMEIVEVKDDEMVTERVARRSKSYIVQVIDALMELIKDAPNYWRTFAQFFLPLRAFASWGSVERQYFMSRNAISQLIDFYLADESPIKYAGPKAKRIRMGDKASSPNVSVMIDLISILVRGSASNVHKELGAPPTQIQDGAPPKMSDEDLAILQCSTFYSRIIKEAANIPATIEIVTHLCWENEATSKALIEVITTGINNVEYEYFKSYFEVFAAILDINDSLKRWRISLGMDLYLVVIAENLQFKNASYHSIKFLVELASKNSDARAWLFENKPKYLEPWLLTASAESVRSITEELVHALIPEVPFPLPETEDLGQLLFQEGRQKLQNLYQYLLSLLSRATSSSKGELESSTKQGEETIINWKLTSYFRLLKWCVVGQLEKQIFFHYATEFITLFLLIDQYQLECDENKKEATALWCHILKDSPENIGVILNNDFYPRRLFDYWISLKGVPRFVEYNNNALPAFYNVLLLCCEQEAFRKKLSMADNFAWAIRHMLLSSEYLPVAAVLTELVKKCSEFPEFRAKQIESSLLKEKIIQAPKQLMSHLEQLLLTSEDCSIFCDHGGLDLLCQLLDRRGENKDKITEEQKAAIGILIHVTGFILAQLSRPKHKLADFVHSWETRQSALFALVQLLDVTLDDLAVNSCYKLIENIVQLDSVCLEKLLTYLIQEHEDLFLRINNPVALLSSTLKKNRLRLKVHQLIEEGVTDGLKFRYVDTYYHFVYKICNIALSLGNKYLPPVADLAILIGIETTRFDSMVCMITALFTKLLEFDVFKRLPLLDFYVTKIFTKDVQLLNKPEVFAFLPKLFAPVQSRLSDADLQAIISAQSERVRSFENVEVADDATLQNFVQTLKAFNIIMLNNYIKNYYTQVNKLLISKVIEIGTNEKVSARLAATNDLEVVNNLIRNLKETK